jgi:hypothetical protein
VDGEEEEVEQVSVDDLVMLQPQVLLGLVKVLLQRHGTRPEQIRWLEKGRLDWLRIEGDAEEGLAGAGEVIGVTIVPRQPRLCLQRQRALSPCQLLLPVLQPPWFLRTLLLPPRPPLSLCPSPPLQQPHPPAIRWLLALFHHTLRIPLLPLHLPRLRVPAAVVGMVRAGEHQSRSRQ